MHLLTAKARAYVYHGNWVADCPDPECGNVEHLFGEERPKGQRTVRKTAFHCSNCGQLSLIEWSDQEAEIMAVLEQRPVPQTRNWYPANHDTAVRFRVEHGQSVDQLRQENRDHGVEAS